MSTRGITGWIGPMRIGRLRRPALSAVLVLTVALVTGCGGGVSGSAEPAASGVTTGSTAAPTPTAPTPAARTPTAPTPTAPTPTEPTPAAPPTSAPTGPSPSMTAPSTSSASPDTSAPDTSAPDTSAPGTTPVGTDLSGEVYGFVRGIDLGTSQLTLDKVDWFTGEAAAQACAKDGVTEHDNGWCTMYYYRNVNPRLRTVPVSDQATITILSGSQGVPGDLAAVSARTAGTSKGLYRMIVTDGAVTELHQLYFP